MFLSSRGSKRRRTRVPELAEGYEAFHTLAAMDEELEDVVALQRSGRGKLVALAVLAIGALGAGAYFALGGSGSVGAADLPDKVLIVGPEGLELEEWLHDRGFSARQMSFASAVSAGQELDPNLDDLLAAARFADQNGYGYLAVHPADLHEYDAFGKGEEIARPDGATVAVISIGDLADPSTVTFGVPSRAVEHERPAAQQVGLFLALFEQPHLGRILREEVSPADMNAYNAFGEKDTLGRYQRLLEAQRKFDKYEAQWEVGAELPPTPVPTSPLGGPFEEVDAYPLATGGILALGSRPTWRSKNGFFAEMEQSERVARYLSPKDVHAGKGGSLAGVGEPCGPVDASGIHQLRVSDTGDALALRREIPDGGDTSHWAVQFLEHDPKAGACPFALVGYPLQSRQVYELGPPHPVGAMLMVSDRVRFGFKGRERSWNYPLIGPDGGAAAWVDGTLVAYAGSSRYDESDNHGLAFLSALTEERLEFFVPLSALLPEQDIEPLWIEHIRPLSPDRFLLVLGDRRALSRSLIEVEFTRPVRSRLVSVDHTGDLPAQFQRVKTTSNAGISTRVLVESMPEFDNATFDQAGTMLAYAHAGGAFVLALDSAEPRPLTPPENRVRDVRISPDGTFVLYHREVQAADTTVRTAHVAWLE